MDIKVWCRWSILIPNFLIYTWNFNFVPGYHWDQDLDSENWEFGPWKLGSECSFWDRDAVRCRNSGSVEVTTCHGRGRNSFLCQPRKNISLGYCICLRSMSLCRTQAFQGISNRIMIIMARWHNSLVLATWVSERTDSGRNWAQLGYPKTPETINQVVFP